MPLCTLRVRDLHDPNGDLTMARLPDLLDSLTIPGHYQLIAGVLFSFDVPLADGVARPF